MRNESIIHIYTYRYEDGLSYVRFIFIRKSTLLRAKKEKMGKRKRDGNKSVFLVDSTL